MRIKIITTISSFVILGILALAIYLETNNDVAPKDSSAAATIFVNPTQNIQNIIDASTTQSGDTIILEDGIYYQSIVINKSITLRARNSGKAIISGALGSDLVFTPVAGTTGLYSAPLVYNDVDINYGPLDDSPDNTSFKQFNGWVRHKVGNKNRNLFNYDTLGELREFKFKSWNYWPGPKEGFAYNDADKRIYIRLQNNVNPNNENIEVSRTATGTGIKIVRSDVSVEGLIITTWPGKGLSVEGNVRNIRIGNNFFEGNFEQLKITGGTYEQNYDIFVENNEFSKYPTYELATKDPTGTNDNNGIVAWQAFDNGVNPGGQERWSTIYRSNLGMPTIQGSLNGVYVRNNYIYEQFDGIFIDGWGGNSEDTEIESEVGYNVIRNIVDNPLEYDTQNKNVNIRTHHNFVLDGLAYLSMSCFRYGKSLVDHNIFYRTPDFGLTRPVYWLKTPSNCGSPSDGNLNLKNLTVTHNTVVLGYSSAQKGNFYIENSGESSFQNSIIQNNILLINNKPPASSSWELTNGEGFRFAPENLVYYNQGNIPTSFLPSGVLYENPNFVSDVISANIMDFRLRNNSSAIGRGVADSEFLEVTSNGSDFGAIEYGQEWSMPKPGPNWADISALTERPAIPASLDPLWLGLHEEIIPTPTPELGIITNVTQVCDSEIHLNINWSNPVNDTEVSWVDIGTDINFNTFYHKNVTGVTSTTAPSGFTKQRGTGTTSLLFAANSQYFLRVWNGGHSEIYEFTTNSCTIPTPTVIVTPIPTPIPSPTPVPTPAGYCGDGILQRNRGEQCDDGNNSENDECMNSCRYKKIFIRWF